MKLFREDGGGGSGYQSSPFIIVCTIHIDGGISYPL